MKSKRRIIQVFEHERISIHETQQKTALSKAELNELLKFNDQNQNKYFVPIRDGIKFTSYVGVIQIGKLTLEILPKADRARHSSDAEYNVWRNVLLSMLRICKHINVDSVSEAKLKRRQNSLLDIYFQMYIDAVHQIIHEGLHKKYKQETDNISVWKGKIKFAKHIQKNLVHKENFYTSHQIYSRDHLVNQILKKGLQIILSISNRSDITKSANTLLTHFEGVSNIKVTEKTFERINPSRKLRSFRTALKMSHIIILNYSSEIKSGGTKLLALLFDMNTLWEEYIYRMLLRTKSTDFSFSAQESKRFWETKLVRPDIVLKRLGSNETYIIDAKWKIIEHSKPADADLKQMYVYNMYWDAAKSMLLYPSNNLVEEEFGSYHKGRQGKNQCKVGFLNIIDKDGNLDRQVGEKILQKLEEN